MRRFKDKIAVITGASSGIGRAIALALGKEGAKLYLVGRRLDKLEMVANLAIKNGSWANCYQADLTIDKDMRRLVEKLTRDFGKLDILIHSAGFISFNVVECASIEDLDQHYHVNVRAPYVLTQLLLPMLRASQGQIVFVNSIVAVRAARAKQSQYAATKYALKAVADSLREEVNVDGIRVISVYPASSATPMQEKVCAMEGKEYHPEKLMRPDDTAVMVICALSLPQSAEVTDIMIRPMNKHTAAQAFK